MLAWVEKIGVVEVSAFIGAFYTIARAIIWITPTKKDDKLLSKYDFKLKILAKIVGLDLTQGRKKHGP